MDKFISESLKHINKKSNELNNLCSICLLNEEGKKYEIKFYILFSQKITDGSYINQIFCDDKEIIKLLKKEQKEYGFIIRKISCKKYFGYLKSGQPKWSFLFKKGRKKVIKQYGYMNIGE